MHGDVFAVHGSKIEVYFNIKDGAQQNIAQGICCAVLQKWGTEYGSIFDLPCKLEKLKDRTDTGVTASGIGD